MIEKPRIRVCGERAKVFVSLSYPIRPWDLIKASNLLFKVAGAIGRIDDRHYIMCLGGVELWGSESSDELTEMLLVDLSKPPRFIPPHRDQHQTQVKDWPDCNQPKRKNAA